MRTGMRPRAFTLERLGIESWVRLLGSRSHWFCSQTCRWRTRRIIGITTTITIAFTTGLIE
jgi:hypothetical protein